MGGCIEFNPPNAAQVNVLVLRRSVFGILLTIGKPHFVEKIIWNWPLKETWKALVTSELELVGSIIDSVQYLGNNSKHQILCPVL